jgi:flagellin-like hook-associated protein FlgL
VNTLKDGSGKLTLADLNEESANLLALQTRQQLGLNSLALAAQSERAILSLFG